MEAHDQERRHVGASQGQAVMPLSDMVAKIETREDLATFVAALRRDLLGSPDDWENPTLERYLEALAA